MKDRLTIARQAAAIGAGLLQTKFSHDAGVDNTNGKDIKTQADLAAQELILEELSSTHIPVLAEEGEQQRIDLEDQVWIVDPLDGTFNFSRGFRFSAVSIALWQDGKPVLGVVHDIFSGHVYTGQVGKGAYMDDKKISVSEVTDNLQAVLATGFPSGRNYNTDSLLKFVHSVQNYKKVRMLGSAALMLVHVATGCFDIYEEDDIYIWDVAAGLAIVKAAGGVYTMQPGAGKFKYHVRATNGHL